MEDKEAKLLEALDKKTEELREIRERLNVIRNREARIEAEKTAKQREKEDRKAERQAEKDEKEALLWVPICRFTAQDYDEATEVYYGAECTVELRQHSETSQVMTVKVED